MADCSDDYQIKKYSAKVFPNDKTVDLIDYHNDVENEIINLAKSGIKIYFICIAKNLVDFSLQRKNENKTKNYVALTHILLILL